MQRKPDSFTYMHRRVPSSVISGSTGAIDWISFASLLGEDTAIFNSSADSTFAWGPVRSRALSTAVSLEPSRSVHLRASSVVHILGLPMSGLYRVDATRQGRIVAGNGGFMGKRVANIYGKTANPKVMTLEVISSGIYDIEVIFDAEFHDLLSKHSWCFEQSKGLVYTMDLTLELPAKMGYSTARVYLRDFIMYHAGKWGDMRPSHIWERALDNYCMASGRLLPITYAASVVP